MPPHPHTPDVLHVEHPPPPCLWVNSLRSRHCLNVTSSRKEARPELPGWDRRPFLNPGLGLSKCLAVFPQGSPGSSGGHDPRPGNTLSQWENSEGRGRLAQYRRPSDTRGPFVKGSCTAQGSPLCRVDCPHLYRGCHMGLPRAAPGRTPGGKSIFEKRFAGSTGPQEHSGVLLQTRPHVGLDPSHTAPGA